MKKLNLKILGLTERNQPFFYINGKEVIPKKNQFGSFQIDYETDDEEITLEIYKELEINGRFWLITALFFFIISLLGILSPRYDKACLYISCKYRIKLNENNEVKMTFVNQKDNNRVEIEADCSYDEIECEFYQDKKAKKHLRTLAFIKPLIWVITIILIIYFIINH